VIVPLADAGDASLFGGKAASLATALRAGLPVPPGFALSVEAAAAVSSEPHATDLAACLASSGERWAVRSSAVGEDGAAASFAGQHLTVLGVSTADVPAAVAKVVASGRGGGARAYRARMGLGDAGMAVVVQALLPAEVAGVLFTVDPVTGTPGIVVEAAWGLGEAVVSGLVTPDHWRLDADGALVEHRPGSRDVQVVARDGGAREEPLPPDRAGRACLSAADLTALVALVRDVDRVWAGPHDLEFAFSGGSLWLLQRRPVTRGGR
jgi:pyruvate,water dikinase